MSGLSAGERIVTIT